MDRSPARPWRLLVIPIILIIGFLAARYVGLGQTLELLRDWMKGLGPWGALIFVLLYAGAAVAAVPGSALTIAAGALFGSGWGIVLVSLASTLGASLAFLVSRYLAREAVVQWLGQNDRFQRLDRLTAEHGAIMVALTRLTPIIPYNLLNYGFGLTRTPFWTYVFWTWLCMLPATVLYVVGADAVAQGLTRGEIPWGLVLWLAAAAALLAVLVKMAGRKLQARERQSLAAAPADAPPFTWSPPALEPDDDHNRLLTANVRPPGWVNPVPVPRYNLVVIGGGAAGLVTAVGAAGLGAKVALVERHLLGGDCLTHGCVPSKAVLRASRALAAVQAAPAFGIKVGGPVEADFAAVMERMRRLRAQISHHDAARRFQELGIDVFLGAARFISPAAVQVEGATLHFHRAVVATGGRPVAPSVEGLREAGYLTSDTVFSLTRRPERLLVLGGGPIGCELAQALQRLGCQVTLLHKHDRIMNREDEEAAALLQQVLAAEGIRLLLRARPLRVVRSTGGKVVAYESQDGPGTLEVDEILVGAGRAPNVEGLQLEAAGVDYEAGRGRGVLVNDRLQTSNPRIYAAGDVCLPYQFTHLADAAARIAIQNALFGGRRKLSSLTIPWCTYTDPEVAQVGLTEAGAEKQGLAIQTFRKPLGEVDRAILDGQEQGFVKVHVRAGTDRIVGATVVAAHAGEMISEITTAMVSRTGLGAVAGIIHPYPTQAEAFRQTGDLYNRTRLTPFRQRVLSRYFAWRRR